MPAGTRRAVAPAFSAALAWNRNGSAVPAARTAIRADAVRPAKGFHEELPLANSDVNSYLQDCGVPDLFHHESASLGRHDSALHLSQNARDVTVMRQRWDVLQADPFDSPKPPLDRAAGLLSRPA